MFKSIEAVVAKYSVTPRSVTTLRQLNTRREAGTSG